MSEGVEIMNLLMTLSEHDKTLNKQIMKKEDPYFFFREKMGRVEIIFHDVLIPVYFFVPPNLSPASSSHLSNCFL